MGTKEQTNTMHSVINYLPKVGIIILNWNRWEDTLECLESVYRNVYQNYQVIVVDNGSIDGSVERIKEWADGKQELTTNKNDNPLYVLSYPTVKKPVCYICYNRDEAEKGENSDLESQISKKNRNAFTDNMKRKPPTTIEPLIIIQTGKNLGFAGGNNVGIRYIHNKDDFDYLWLLNNDTVIDSNALSEMVKLICSDNKIGMVGSKLLLYDRPEVIQVLGGTDKITWKNPGGTLLYYGMEDSLCPDTDFELKGYISGASLLVKNEVIKNIGLLDENYFMLAEETDWCFRASQAGWKLYCSTKSKVWHKVGASVKNKKGKTFPIYYDYYETRNHLYFVRKHFSKEFLIASIFYFFIGIKKSVKVVMFSKNDKWKNIKALLKGYYDGIKGVTGEVI